MVAETQEGVIGLASLTVFASPRMRHGGEIGMFVDENFQGKGVGSQLLQALVDYSENWLASIRIELTVYIGNEPAIVLYKKFGFEIEGTKRNYLHAMVHTATTTS